MKTSFFLSSFLFFKNLLIWEFSSLIHFSSLPRILFIIIIIIISPLYNRLRLSCFFFFSLRISFFFLSFFFVICYNLIWIFCSMKAIIQLIAMNWSVKIYSWYIWNFYMGRKNSKFFNFSFPIIIIIFQRAIIRRKF